MKQRDVDSVRLGGMTVDKLPIGERARTLPQLKAVEDNQKFRDAEGIKAEYPPQTVAYCVTKIAESKENQLKITAMRDKAMADILSYKMLIKDCANRDRLLGLTKDTDAIKALKKEFPPYDVKAMQVQIKQFEETVTRCDGVIDAEVDAIQKFAGLQTICEQRDTKLKALGA